MRGPNLTEPRLVPATVGDPSPPPPITGHTRILGVVADPVSQARTPGMANALLQQRGLLGSFVLLPMHVGASDFAAFMSGLRAIRNFGGAVVSMPHKVVACEWVDELTPEARLVGALNVVRRNADGSLTGTMLDGEGFVAGLLGAGHVVQGRDFLLVGAGGAASALAFALAKHGCGSLCILNRTQDRADALAVRVRQAYPRVKVSTSDHPTAHYHVGINGTSLGMKVGDALPLSAAQMERCAMLAECVVAPEKTPLLTLAASQGKTIHTGVPMLAAQMNLMLAFMVAEGA